MPEEKRLEDLTPEEFKELKIVFAPGSFDNFDGTQEELDAFIAEITEMVRSGEILEKGRPVDLDEMDPEEAEFLERVLTNNTGTRNLQ